MTITRNVGTAAGSLAANTTALQNAIDLGAATDDVRIVLGANARFECVCWNTNVTANPMVIIAADRSNPPIMTEGFRFCGSDDEGWFNKLGGGASTVRNITIDGVHFIPRHITQTTPGPTIPGDAHAHPVVFLDAPPGGYAWRIDPTFDGFNSGGKNQGYGAGAAYMTALAGFQGTQNIIVQNCYFRGYGRAIKGGGANGFIFRHNTWEGWHEDCFYVDGGDNITIEYNFWNQSSTISYRDAHFGWWYGAVGNPDTRPPHPDVIQAFDNTTNFIVQFNVMYDDDTSHFCLHQIGQSGSGNHVGSIFRNNYLSMRDDTGLWIGDNRSLLVERNKIYKNGGSENPKLYLEPNNTTGIIVRNNTVFQLRPVPANLNSGWTWTGNEGGNTDPNDTPAGWVEMRPGNRPGTSTPWTAPGNRVAGQYGGTGGVPQTPPSFSTTPGLDPRPQVEAGDTLTATPGVVSGNPTPTTSHRWFNNGVLIAAQTDTTYPTVNPGDINDVITYQTRANNGVGGNVDSSVSNAVTVITPVVVPPDTAPVFTTVPAINPTDSVTVGAVLTRTRGVATGNPAPTFSDRWFRNGVLNAAVTGSTYTTTALDVGLPITYRTRAVNTAAPSGVDSSFSNEVTVLSNAPPAGLTAGQVAFREIVVDPARPTDVRRTFTITVPASSPAANANAMFWSNALDPVTTIRPMIQEADVGGEEVWRAAPIGNISTAHLRNPGASFTDVHLYYRVTSTSLQSDISTYSFTATVPAAPFGTDTKRIDTTTLSRCRFGGHEGLALRFNGVTYWGDTAIFAATGGTVTTSGGYKYHTFTTSGSFTVTEGSRTDAEMLLIGGGGSGGEFRAGGGGAGRVRVLPDLSLSPQAYTITVGNGGASVSSGGGGNFGTASTALGFTSVTGGGGGGSDGPVGKPGGGGGSGGPIGGTNAAGAANAGGFAGGAGFLSATNNERKGGGGGGATAAGVAGTATQAGRGGAGISLSWPTAVVYASGGGGGTSAATGWGLGGTSGNGDGGASGKPPTAGLTPGSGGGGSGPDGQASGAGANGIVIIRYPV